MSKYKATPERIAELKKQHPKGLFMVEVEDHTAILRSPTRKELGYAATVGKADPLKFNQTILEKTWLEGDEAIKTEDRLFMGVCEQLDQVVDTAEASIKKL